MEQYIVYLLYIAILLIVGLFITAITRKLNLSSILFLVVAGYLLNILGLNFFNDEIVLVLSAVALVLISLETSMELNLVAIARDFLNVLKFSVMHFFLCTYILTLAIFQLFDFPGKGFEAFALCLLLSIIIYGVDPAIAMEFFKTKKGKAREMLEMEGILSSPIVIVFSFFIISYLNSSNSSFSFGFINNVFTLLKEALFALIIGVSLAFLVYKLINSFDAGNEVSALFIITTSIIVFVLSEFFHAEGTLAIVVYGIFLRGLTKEDIPKKYASFFAHTFYLMVFILLGAVFMLPEPLLWVKGAGLFIVYLILRFFSVQLCIKGISFKEKLFMSLNVSKGIEVAIVLFIMKLNFNAIPGINLILSMGYIFFIFGYILSTFTNHFINPYLDSKENRQHS